MDRAHMAVIGRCLFQYGHAGDRRILLKEVLLDAPGPEG